MNRLIMITLLVAQVGAPTAASQQEEELAELSNADHCDHRLVSIMIEAEAAGLRLTGDHLRRTLILCEAYIDAELSQRSCQLTRGNQIVDRFTLLARRTYDLWSKAHPQDKRRALCNDSSRLISDTELANYLYSLSQMDPEARLKEVVFNETSRTTSIVQRPDHFELALHRYLLEPCAEIQRALGDLLAGAKAIGRLHSNLGVFLDKQSGEFRRLAWTSQLCGQWVLKMSPERRAKLAHESLGGCSYLRLSSIAANGQ